MRERYQGSLLGLAVGDALGGPVEGALAGSFEPIDDLRGGGPHGLRPGEWTDDTGMALCLADSLLAERGHDAADQLDRYRRWWKEGYNGTRDQGVGIGRTVTTAIERFINDGSTEAPTDDASEGNGALMRVAPAVLAFARDQRAAVAAAALTARTTHGNPAAVDPCRYFASLLHDALHGIPKEDMLGHIGLRHRELWHDDKLEPLTTEVASGSFRSQEAGRLTGLGRAPAALEAALWAVHSTSSYKDAVLTAANLGDDADTVAAIAGQLAGALYGVDAIPRAWRAKVFRAEELLRVADELYELAQDIDVEPVLRAAGSPT